ncbi:PAS domain S-box-containing protein/diguanylate cyclase (GGDEF) domain-containing protein [Nakamurella panacisegetis]|uniref:PAS domain S-box-containing protein/diguanylate cyclase (GGDEF) domain-containing protein n=1 Tax=Nakamurella panacisegetis TaxID=1090615 RepID=A0A1H0RJ44_9ACTN|nr:sensor domain-containing diguanylate cyclase [Nakamurella panacisegetis]SDP29229.1 PAS domain S-box-containing protein/diguanylate cyclase (GGDEF) domain-containing protein [Nakamurella panacisegetis]
MSAIIGAHRLHQVIIGVHGAPQIAQTVQAITDAVVTFAGFDVAALSVLGSGEVLEMVAVSGSEEARSFLLGTKKARQLYEDEFAVADVWGKLLFVPHGRVSDASGRGWIPPSPTGRTRGRRWHPLDALYAPLHSPTGTLVGVLSVDLPINGRRPGRRQRELLEILALQAGAAIDNANITEQLRASERLFRRSFDRAGIGMALISLAPDNYGRYLRVNPMFCRIVGREENAILQLTSAQLTHPDDQAEDVRQLRALHTGTESMYQRDKRYIKGDGTPVWVTITVSSSGSPNRTADYAIGQIEDITHRREQHQALQHQAQHDPLTGLANRTALITRLLEAVTTAQHTGSTGAVLFIDLDGFKTVNDRHGHPTGDQVLTIVADRIAAAVRPEDLVARIGGDEFVVVADNLTTTHTHQLTTKIITTIGALITLPGGTRLQVQASIGYTPIHPAGHQTPQQLIAEAEPPRHVRTPTGLRAQRFAGL